MGNMAMICWAIWKERCNVVFKRKSVDVIGCMMKIKEAMAELIQLQENSKERVMNEKQGGNEGWRKPRPGQVKINYDGLLKEVMKK